MAEIIFIVTTIFIIYAVFAAFRNNKTKSENYNHNVEAESGFEIGVKKLHTYYDDLKVARNAPEIVIKAAYKALCQTYHPDKFQGSKEESERIMKIINRSYVELIDSEKRAEHDAWIKKNETP